MKNLSWKIGILKSFISSYPYDLSIKSIDIDIVSTYDGEYPNIIVKFLGNKEISRSSTQIKRDFIYAIQNYLNLVSGKDFWISVEVFR